VVVDFNCYLYVISESESLQLQTLFGEDGIHVSISYEISLGSEP